MLALLSFHRYSGIIQRAINQGLALPFFRTFHRGTESSFYNRAQEVEQLSTRLKKEPKFTVLLGPPSSGKTALVRHVTSQMRPDGTPEFHPLTINLRAVDTFEEGSFLDAFKEKVASAAARDIIWKRLYAGRNRGV